MCGTENRFWSCASWGGPWEEKVQGKESPNLEQAWMEEGSQGDAREGRTGDSVQSQIEAVK